jgi:poly-beta-1,6-N-acetyl-D-glucosamine synthase
MTAEHSFIVAFVFILYTYLGYPCLLLLFTLLSAKAIKKRPFVELPFVSVVIAARNEAGQIATRLNNLLEQDYPADKLEIIVVSDGSVDDTNVIVFDQFVQNSELFPKIKLIIQPKPSGKPLACNLGVYSADGEIIVFTDSRQIFAKNAISELISNFSDCEIGGVSGELLFFDKKGDGLLLEMGAYWHYEKMVRKLESRWSSVMGATGAIYAIRKKLYHELPASTLLDDVLTPLNIVLAGYRVTFDHNAIAYDYASNNVQQEWKRKVRTLSGNWQILNLCPSVLNPFHIKLFWQFFSHKLARLLVPYFLITLFISSVTAEGMLYSMTALLQICFYLMVLIAFMFPQARQNALIRLCYFFCVLNVAALFSCWIWIFGRHENVWKPKA